MKSRLQFFNDKEIRLDETDDPNSTAKTMAQGSIYHQSGTDKWFVKRAGGSGTDFSEIDKGFLRPDFNIYPRGDAESALVSDFTDSANMTMSLTTTAANVARGSKAFSFVATATAATSESDTVNIPNAYQEAGRIFLNFWMKNNGDTVIKLNNKTDTTVLIEETIADNSSTWTFYQFSAEFPNTCEQVSWEIESTGAYTAYVDDLYIGFKGQQYSVQSANVTAWESWTPTGGWSANTTFTGLKRQVGENMEYEVHVALSGAPTGTLTIDLPSGDIIDTSKHIGTNSSSFNIFRDSACAIYDSGTNEYAGAVQYNSTTSVVLSAFSDAGSVLESIISITATAPFTFASGDTVTARWSVPLTRLRATSDLLITESDNVAPSRAYANNATAVATGTTTFIGFGTKDFDNDALFTNIGSANNTTYTSTTYWTCPKTGYYLVGAAVLVSDADLDLNEASQIRVYKNGATLLRVFSNKTLEGSPTTATYQISGHDLIYVTKNDKLSIALVHTAAADVTLDADANSSWFTVTRHDKQPVIAAHKRYMQTKYLSADFSTNSAEITDLTFSNLTIGNVYTLQAHTAFNKDSADATASVLVYNNTSGTSDQLGTPFYGDANTSTNDQVTYESFTTTFVAVATKVRFVTSGFAAGTNLFGSGTKGNTFATLIEEANTSVTTRFT